MGRLQIRTERLAPSVIETINRCSFSSLSAYWRRYLDETDCTLAQFSAAMRGDMTDPVTVNLILESIPIAALEQPFKEVLTISCSKCGCDFEDNPVIVSTFSKDCNKKEYCREDYDFAERVRLKR